MRILAVTFSAAGVTPAGVTPMTFKIERIVGRENEIVLRVCVECPANFVPVSDMGNWHERSL
jgi:hypothetical protein